MKRIFVLFLLVAFSLQMFSLDSTGFIPQEKPFCLDWTLDGILLGGGVAGFTTTAIVSQWANKALSPYTDGKRDADEVGAFDRWSAGRFSETADMISDVGQVAAMVAPLVLCALPESEWSTVIIMYAEALAWSWTLKESLKSGVQRYRPYMYGDDFPEDKVDEGDYLRSFPSGHTTLAFNGAVFTSYVFAKYFPNRVSTYVVIPTVCSVAVATAALRVAAGAHFLSDVLAGAALGAFTGFLVPFLHTLPAKKSSVTPVVSPAGVSLRAKF